MAGGRASEMASEAAAAHAAACAAAAKKLVYKESTKKVLRTIEIPEDFFCTSNQTERAQIALRIIENSIGRIKCAQCATPVYVTHIYRSRLADVLHRHVGEPFRSFCSAECAEQYTVNKIMELAKQGLV